VRFRSLLALVALLPIAPLASASAQQGAFREYPGLETGKMWQFDVPPLEYWNTRYGFQPPAGWLDHARLSALRYAGYCSASFVSGQGLVMTNHHCGRECIESATQPGEDLLSNGFVAATPADERACKGIFLDQLQEITDVTGRVQGAIGNAKPEEAARLRTSTIAAIEKECIAAVTDVFCQVVTLYRGGQYKLYRFRRFTDVRLVMAPESQMAFFGGDPDNFTYPRYDIDMSFVRAYVDGKPAVTDQHFAWSKAGAKEDELLFVIGNPGSTGRLNTMSQLKYLRDVSYPAQMATLDRRIGVTEQLSTVTEERAKALRNQLFSLQNSRKAIGGYQAGLLDPKLMAQKSAWEADFRKRVAANPAFQLKYGKAWGEIALVQQELRATAARRRMYTLNADLSRLLPTAGMFVRYNDEVAKPDSLRLPMYRDANRKALEIAMVAGAPIDTIAERLWLTAWFGTLQKDLPPTDPVRRAALGGRTPAAAAEAMLASTTLISPERRLALFQSGETGIAASKDPFIVLARVIDPLDRSMTKQVQALSSRESAATELIARALLATFGNSVAPDATFSLRISDGQPKRYPMNGTFAPAFTTFYGLYDRSIGFESAGPWTLPQRWQERKDSLTLATPYNVASTNDIIGGNSGSPVINRDAEVVGLIFDGNIEGLPNRFLFTEYQARAVYLDSRAIIEALRSIYGAKALADELTGPAS
jgi:hypothetical protein